MPAILDTEVKEDQAYALNVQMCMHAALEARCAHARHEFGKRPAPFEEHAALMVQEIKSDMNKRYYLMFASFFVCVPCGTCSEKISARDISRSKAGQPAAKAQAAPRRIPGSGSPIGDPNFKTVLLWHKRALFE